MPDLSADSARSPIPTRQRVLNLEHGCNFRDLGGYQTTDGRQLRWGQIFRSGVMAHLTDQDQAVVERLGIRVVIDLRREDERRKEPTRWAGPDVRLLHADHPLDQMTLSLLAKGQTHTLESARKTLIDLYRSMPEWLGPRMQALFKALGNDVGPLLFNCSAGKDRTGFAAAVVLEALGVSRETVLQDYLLTNTAVDLEAFVLKHHASGLGLTEEAHPLLSIAPGIRRSMIIADADYLEAALDVIRREHGSASRYISHSLGLGEPIVEQMRQRYLTD